MDEALMKELRQINQNTGAILANQTNLSQRMDGLHAKAEEIETKLDKHKEDPNAHGLQTAEQAIDKNSDRFIKWATLGAAILATVIAAWTVVRQPATENRLADRPRDRRAWADRDDNNRSEAKTP